MGFGRVWAAFWGRLEDGREDKKRGRSEREGGQGQRPPMMLFIWALRLVDCASSRARSAL